MTTPSQTRIDTKYKQIFYDKRLRSVLDFIVRHNGTISTKEIATIGIAKQCHACLEKIEKNEPTLQPTILAMKSTCEKLAQEYGELFEGCPLEDTRKE